MSDERQWPNGWALAIVEVIADAFNQYGGLGKAYQLFGAELPRILTELNERLVA